MEYFYFILFTREENSDGVIILLSLRTSKISIASFFIALSLFPLCIPSRNHRFQFATISLRHLNVVTKRLLTK